MSHLTQFFSFFNFLWKNCKLSLICTGECQSILWAGKWHQIVFLQSILRFRVERQELNFLLGYPMQTTRKNHLVLHRNLQHAFHFVCFSLLLLLVWFYRVIATSKTCHRMWKFFRHLSRQVTTTWSWYFIQKRIKLMMCYFGWSQWHV